MPGYISIRFYGCCAYSSFLFILTDKRVTRVIDCEEEGGLVVYITRFERIESYFSPNELTYNSTEMLSTRGADRAAN